jgi:hypothetical protein
MEKLSPWGDFRAKYGNTGEANGQYYNPFMLWNL